MDNSEIVYLYLDDIIPNRFQPREIFDDQALKELAVSIKEHGVIQPIIVRKVENKYEIIAGERRYKASTMAGLTKIPAIIKNLDDKESSKVALIENLQRKDLSPIEEARTYQKILELEGSMTQEELAATMGKTQSSVSNKLRLLELPEEIQDALLKEKISERHARTLLTIEDKNDQIKMMDKVIAEKMTVRDLEKEIKALKENVSSSDSIANIAPIPAPTPSTSVSDSNINLDNIELPKPNLESFSGNDETSEDSGTTSAFTFNSQPLSEPKTEEENGEVKADTSSSEENDPAEMYTSYFDSNLGNDPNSSFASSILTNAISAPITTETKDISKAITDVKNTITNLQNDGYKVSFEETDDSSNYKISIQIDKN